MLSRERVPLAAASEHEPGRMAYITAGAAGMYCGSCMHDNTLVRAIRRQHGWDCLLVPTYTPIRTDEEDVSIRRVFLGGITVYLEQQMPWLRFLPRWMLNWLNQPWLIRWAAQRAVKTDPAQLGALAVSLLRGPQGYQRRDIEQLADWLARVVRPQVVVLSNMLIGGCIPELKKRLHCPIVATLQGDDIFLNELHEPFRSQAVAEIRRLVLQVEAFIVHSQYYADYMGEWFQIPREKIHQLPLCIDCHGFPENQDDSAATTTRPLTIGYLARLAPEKGLHLLVDAFLKLKRLPGMEGLRLAVAGWLGPQQRKYAEQQFVKVRQAGCSADFSYIGAVDRAGKIEFLKSIDVLSVPTEYADPKGLFVLEALAAGVPVVQPSHGAFPELLGATGGGVLFRPRDVDDLVSCLRQLLAEPQRRRALGEQGRQYVRQHLHCDVVAGKFLEIVQHVVGHR